MPLLDHLRELRGRLVLGVAAIVVATIVAFAFYDPILDLLTQPYAQIRPDLEREGIESNIVITGIGGALQFQLKISFVTGLIVSSPIWLWQAWAFVLPALHRQEKKWAVLLTAVCVPLFVGGAVLAFWVLPKAIVVLIGFIPDEVQSLVTGAEYFDFVIRMMLVFGVSAQIPVVVVLLNRLGVLPADRLASARPWTIVGIFVFAAVATPSTDPVSFLFLALPMVVLYLLAELVARMHDRRRRRPALPAR